VGVQVGVLAVGAASKSKRFLPVVAVLFASVCSCLMVGGAAIAARLLPTVPTTSAAAGDVEAAVTYAEQQVGQPYLWGGESVGGFDCSGLVWAAYRTIGIDLPRVAQEQFDAGARLSVDEQPQRGGLVFFGSSTDAIDHVGIVVAPDLMIDAPHSGATVRVEDFHWSDYIGATRPSARG
jgi:cell wall-associated NlpC family hydrolase